MDTARFQFIADALHGTGGFRPPATGASESNSYLVMYPRESAEKFSRRNQVAWYANDMASACSRFAGYLSKRRPMRTLDNPLLAAMTDDCDWRGNHLDVFWGSFTIEAKARGVMLLLVDMPRDLGASRAEQMEARAFPYLTMIPPELVSDYGVNERGLLDRVEVRDIEDPDRYHGWDTEGWWTRKGEEIEEQGQHPLGVCPVLAFAESEFPHPGEFAQIADLSKRLFNMRSELDEILRGQTFSILAYQIPTDQVGIMDIAEVAAEIGTSNMLMHSGTTPGFIAPPDGPAATYLAVIAQLEDKIRRIGHVVEAPDQAESGIALSIRFQQLNSSLSHWASRMEDLERRVWWLASLWLGIQTEVDVSWSDDYSISDRKTELDVLASMQMTGFSEEALREKRAQILTDEFSTMSDDALAVLIEMEREGAHERADAAVMDDVGLEAVA